MRLVEIPAKTLEDEIAALRCVRGFGEEALMANGAIIALTALLSAAPTMSQILASNIRTNGQAGH